MVRSCIQGSLHNTVFSQGCVLADGSLYGNGGQRPHCKGSRRGEELPIAQSSSWVNRLLHCDLLQHALHKEFHLNTQQMEKSKDLEATGALLATWF